MILTPRAIEKISEPQIRRLIAYKMDLTEDWIRKLVKENKTNSKLTTAKALETIRQSTGLNDSEILEEGNDQELNGNGKANTGN